MVEESSISNLVKQGGAEFSVIVSYILCSFFVLIGIVILFIGIRI